MPTFEEKVGGAKVIDVFAQGLGRRSTAEEHTWPLIFLDSSGASYLTGENINVDGGTVSAITTRRIVLSFDSNPDA
jgi:hypothetical protein